MQKKIAMTLTTGSPIGTGTANGREQKRNRAKRRGFPFLFRMEHC